MNIMVFLKNRFRAREIFVRADGRVRYVRLSSTVQVIGFAALLMAAGWATFATISMQKRGETIASQKVRISAIERDRQRLGGELAATRAYFPMLLLKSPASIAHFSAWRLHVAHWKVS